MNTLRAGERRQLLGHHVVLALALAVHEADQPGGVLQPREVKIAVHPIDTLDFKADLLG